MSAGFPYRTVIVTPAASKDLTTKETVFAELGVTAPTTAQQDQMEANIHQVSALIVGYCNREFAQETVTDRFRTRGQWGIEALWLSRVPVTAITSVIEDGATLTADDYELDEQSGQLWRLGGGQPRCWASCGLIEITYAGGYVSLETLPHDVERACIDQVKATWGANKRDPSVRGIQIPDVVQTTFSVPGGDSYGTSGLMIQVEGALASYRRLVIG